MIEEYEREAKDEPAPEEEQPRDETHERAQRREVAERLGTEETGERVLLERLENVDFLLVKQVRDERRRLVG